MPVEHIDWLAQVQPYEKPTQEEILADRQKRLDQLDKIQAERAEMFQDTRLGLNWLQKQRGHGGKADGEWWREALTKPAEPIQVEQELLEITLAFSGSPAFLRAVLRALSKMWP